MLSDVSDAYESLRSSEEVVQLYASGYLTQAQDSRDISEYAYKRGAAGLLDFLDAERSNRAVQLAYRQALSSYMTALERERSRRNKEPPVKIRNCAHYRVARFPDDNDGAARRAIFTPDTSAKTTRAIRTKQNCSRPGGTDGAFRFQQSCPQA